MNSYTKLYIKNPDAFNEKENKKYIETLNKEIKVKLRLQYSCIFWLSFYFIGLQYIYRKSGMGLPGRLFLNSFFFIPNYFWYKKRFTDNTINIHNAILDYNEEGYRKIKNAFAHSEYLKLKDNYAMFLKEKGKINLKSTKRLHSKSENKDVNSINVIDNDSNKL